MLRFGMWRFDADVETTRAYADKELTQHCNCGYCRNFYMTVDEKYPNLRPFLSRFGANIEAPDELIPYNPTEYSAAYCVKGTLETSGASPIRVDGLAVTAESGTRSTVNTGLEMPYFVLLIPDMRLPWALDEPPEDVISPANEPGFIQKIVNRFLRRT